MPTNRTRRTRARQELDEHKIGQLHHGPADCLLAGCGYHDAERRLFYWQAPEAAQAAILGEMRRDWQLHRAQVLSTWTGEGEPWAAREFGG